MAKCHPDRPHKARGLCDSCYFKLRYETDYRKWFDGKSLDWKKTQQQKTRIYQRALRQKALDHYGRECACCCESNEEFLAIDHVNGGGSKHRKEVGSIYAWLLKNNYPEGFRTLCHNCNLARGYYGYCPHEIARRTLSATH